MSPCAPGRGDGRDRHGAGKPGILYAKAGIAAGIWNDPEATTRTSRAAGGAPATSSSRDEYGYYDFAGRCDHMFKSGAIKIYSEEVERSLKRHPAVLDAVVLVPRTRPSVWSHGPRTKLGAADGGRDRDGGEGSRLRLQPAAALEVLAQTAFPDADLGQVDRKRLAEDALTDVAGKRGS